MNDEVTTAYLATVGVRKSAQMVIVDEATTGWQQRNRQLRPIATKATNFSFINCSMLVF